MSSSNPYKQNQDAYLTNPHILGLRHCHFFSVCDGHGTNGREVSGFLKENLPLNIESSLISNGVNQINNLYPDYHQMKKSLREAFSHTNDMINQTSGIDVRFSGSTCVSVITYGNKIYVANVGDSRAILIRKGQDDDLFEVAALTRDHKPDDSLEA
jgi:serine/threonine protein phosphatase PrpC